MQSNSDLCLRGKVEVLLVTMDLGGIEATLAEDLVSRVQYVLVFVPLPIPDTTQRKLCRYTQKLVSLQASNFLYFRLYGTDCVDKCCTVPLEMKQTK